MFCCMSFELFILINKNRMSFLSKIGHDLQKDKKLVILRKKYFHDILQFNKNSEQMKRQNAIKQKQQSNVRISIMNTQALKAQQSQKTLKLHQKVVSQMFLKSEYDKQIRQKRQLRKLERQTDKKYVKLQQIQTEKASDRRLQDLMKIYDRVGSESTHRRVKTQALKEIENPQKNRKDLAQTRKHLSPLGFLPPIQKHQKQEQQSKQSLSQSMNERKSERLATKRSLF